jgi:glycerol-3-phosphate dehydrogenase (NAD(P)+)
MPGRMKTVAFIGGGSFGTALSTIVAAKGCRVNIFDIDQDHLARMEADMENKDYLPGVMLKGDYHFCKTNEEALKEADFVIFALPAQHVRSAICSAVPFIRKDAIITCISKGIEQKTHKRMSEVIGEYFDLDRYVCISGPSHAEEVGIGVPTAVAMSSRKESSAAAMADLFTTNRFRVYLNDDMLGMELAASLKNVLAVGSGIIDGLGYGDNTLAAMLTRGCAETTRLGVAMGAKPETFAGLAGIGDMIVTCTSIHSRNFRCGRLIGQGYKPEDAIKEIGMVAEGMYTAEVVHELASTMGVEMPISEAIYDVINGNITVEDAMETLMGRPRGYEVDYL